MLSDMGAESVSAKSAGRSFESAQKGEDENGNDNRQTRRRSCCEPTPVCAVWPTSDIREKNRRSGNSIAASRSGNERMRQRNRLRLGMVDLSASLTECGSPSMVSATHAFSFSSDRSRTAARASEGCVWSKEMSPRQTGAPRFTRHSRQENWLG